MKRTALTIAVLAIALMSVASSRRTMAHFENSQSRLVPGVDRNVALQTEVQSDLLSEEFHQTYPLSPMGRVTIENINGGVHVSVWDRNEVKVESIKKARQREQLDEVKIEVINTADSVRIKTKYPERDSNDE